MTSHHKSQFEFVQHSQNANEGLAESLFMRDSIKTVGRKNARKKGKSEGRISSAEKLR